MDRTEPTERDELWEEVVFLRRETAEKSQELARLKELDTNRDEDFLAERGELRDKLGKLIEERDKIKAERDDARIRLANAMKAAAHNQRTRGTGLIPWPRKEAP